MSDPTAAERARRYRARRAQRDATVTSREPGLEAAIGELLAEIRALRADIHSVDNRDDKPRHAVQRDVTSVTVDEGAPAPARVRARLPAPMGPREPVRLSRDVTGVLDRVADGTIAAQSERILEVLGRAHTPQSAAAIADELDIPAVNVVAALVTLHGAGRVARFAGETAVERDRWAPVAVTSPSETIVCRAYREHATVGHRRDPATGRFRCYVCVPDVGQLSATM